MIEYGYHLTNIDAMENICKEGLKPICGDRSNLVGDKIEGIYFFKSMLFLNNWIDALYQEREKNELELLRFNLEKIDYVRRSKYEFYSTSNINVNEIEYLRILNKESNLFETIDKYNIFNELTTLPCFVDNNELVWDNLQNYKILKRGAL